MLDPERVVRVKDAVGRFGEDLADRTLRSEGLVVVDRNWRCRDGELDLVAFEGRTVVFVEVKTRTSTLFGDPAESVSVTKANRIRGLAARWLREHPDLGHAGVRFDVIAVVRLAPGGPDVRHIRGAF